MPTKSKYYISTIIGYNGVLLEYIIRKNLEPKYDGEDDKYCCFEQLSI